MRNHTRLGSPHTAQSAEKARSDPPHLSEDTLLFWVKLLLDGDWASGRKDSTTRVQVDLRVYFLKLGTVRIEEKENKKFTPEVRPDPAPERPPADILCLEGFSLLFCRWKGFSRIFISFLGVFLIC